MASAATSPLAEAMANMNSGLVEQMSPIYKAVEQMATAQMSPISKTMEQLRTATTAPWAEALAKITSSAALVEQMALSKTMEAIEWDSLLDGLIRQWEDRDFEDVEESDGSLVISGEAADAAIAAIVCVVAYMTALITARQVMASLTVLKMAIELFQFEIDGSLFDSGLLNLLSLAGFFVWIVKSAKGRQPGPDDPSAA